MNFGMKVTFLIGLVSVNCIDLTGWKPILGTNSNLNAIQRPIVADHSIIDSSSSSKSTITFNGQTITTSINDGANTNDAIGSVLTVDPSSDLNGAIDTEGRYLGYPGKILSGFLSTSSAPANDQCPLEKYAFENEGTIQYNTAIPKIEEFTLCAWMRFTNHKGDHSIFTYSVDGEPREIQLWVANTKEASYLSLAVHGQSLFRLNYPLKLRKWHHACVSWNGKIGEWQLWVKAERVGRGFHNRLVSYKIDGGGIAYSGGPSITGPIAPGYHMEITVLQLYKVALSAGKAHRDHRHHHVHHFNHDGVLMTSPALTPAPTEPTPNPLLANGAFPNRLNLNSLDPQQAARILPALQMQFSPGQTQFMNGQFSSIQRLIQQQFNPPSAVSSTPSPTAPVLFPQEPQQPSPPTAYSSSSFFNLNNPADVQFVDDPKSLQSYEQHTIFKRNENDSAKPNRIVERATISESSAAAMDQKKNKKRALIPLSDGSFLDDKNIADAPAYILDGLSQFGAAEFQDGLTRQGSIEDEIAKHDREAAQDEVKAVLSLCSSCDIEPFAGAVILAWKNIKVQQEHSLKGHSVGRCGEF